MARILVAILLGSIFAVGELGAQWLDAQLPRGGELQLGLGGNNTSQEARFRTDGSAESLSSVYAIELDARLVPALDSLDAVLGSLFPALGLPTPAPSTLGPVRYDALLERTRAPLSLTFGITDWLAVFAVVPIVKGKSFVGARVDSLAASAGEASTAFGSANFFNDLAGGIAALDAIVVSDTLPAGAQAEAESLLADARLLESGLTELSQSSYAPTDSSAAGRQLSQFYAALRTGFFGFGVSLPSLRLARALDPTLATALSSGPEFGIDSVRSRSSGIKFGDIEVGLSLQPINSFRKRPEAPRARFPVRLRLDALWRFASGDAPEADQLLDVGTGEGQPDLEFRSTLDFGFGSRLWISLFGSYNIQREADITRLITDPESPIQLGAYTTLVRWDPGDVLTLATAPRFNFTRSITLSGLFMVRRRERDAVTPLDPINPGAAFVPADIERGTKYSARSIGFAARYASTDWSGDRRIGIPVEVELSYLRTTSARDGLVPKESVWRVALRYYNGVFR